MIIRYFTTNTILTTEGAENTESLRTQSNQLNVGDHGEWHPK